MESVAKEAAGIFVVGSGASARQDAANDAAARHDAEHEGPSVLGPDWTMADDPNEPEGRHARTSNERDRIQKEKAELLRRLEDLTAREAEIEGKEVASRPLTEGSIFETIRKTQGASSSGAGIFGAKMDVFSDLAQGRPKSSKADFGRVPTEGAIPPSELWKHMSRQFEPR